MGQAPSLGLTVACNASSMGLTETNARVSAFHLLLNVCNQAFVIMLDL
jgi:hypothetical protein